MKPSRPIGGSLEGTFVSREPGEEGFTCTQAGAVVQTFTKATGQVSHLGNAEAELNHCGIDLDEVAGVLTVEGEAVFVAANGDRLRGSYTGRVSFGDPTTAELSLSINGGSGRFEDALGDGDISVTIQDASRLTMSLAGEISY